MNEIMVILGYVVASALIAMVVVVRGYPVALRLRTARIEHLAGRAAGVTPQRSTL